MRECRKAFYERIVGPEIVEIIMKAYIPCPVCGVVHTPDGDVKINIKGWRK